MTSSDNPAVPLLTSLPEDKWSISQGNSNGKPIFVRINTSAKQYAGHPELAHRLGIAVPLREPNEHGLPIKAEAQELNAIEDVLHQALGEAGRMVLVITTGRMREYVSYLSIKSPEDAKRIVHQIKSGTTTHKIQFYVRPDPTWTGYRQFS